MAGRLWGSTESLALTSSPLACWNRTLSRVEVRVEPDDRLQKCLLLGKLLLLLAQVAADREAVLGSGKEVDLVRLPGLGKNLLRLVALVRRENGVGLGGGYGKGAGDGGELVLVDKRRVRRVADLDTVLVVADDHCAPFNYFHEERGRGGCGKQAYLGTETIAHRANVLDAHLSQGLDRLFDNRIDGLLGVRVVAVAAVRQPLAKIEALGRVERHRVAVEEVNHDRQVQDADILAGRLLGWGGDVGLDGVVNLDDFALGYIRSLSTRECITSGSFLQQ
ncbi:hypothetical protein HC256_004793 [Beauveria bassiana]|nr:hypothetical protein HC256_004793 [Beauveria bassiana]